MQITLTPYYKDIFNEEVPDLKKLIAEVPTKVLVAYLSYLNSKLYLNSSIEHQIEILNEMLKRQNSETKHQIKENIKRFISTNKGNREIGLVSNFHLLSLIHYSLCSYSEFDIIDTTPAQELNIFKAYMVIVNQKSNESSETYQREREIKEGDFFPKHTWPVLLNQMEATPHYEPISDLIRAMCFFNFLEYHSIYSEYVKKFVKNNGQNGTWGYVMSIMSIMAQRWNNENNNRNASFLINCDDNTKPLFESLCLNPITYGLIYKDKKENHSLIKATPLFKYMGRYIVLDWNYFSNKLYDGLIFDFFNRSGIKGIKEVNSIPKLKKVIGKDITEGFTFQKLLTGIFNKKYTSLQFPINDSNGEPDGLYREGNKIILFEIKDAFFSSSVLTSNSYQQIKSEIDKKYNNQKKGTGQLLKQIQKLKEGSFENKSYAQLCKKPRNLKIYPVIIYTDIHFGMPGVSNYIIDEFEKQVSLMNLKNSFRRIEKLTFLSLNFFIQNFNCIKEIGLINIIEMLHHELDKRKKKHELKREIKYLFNHNNPPEQIIQEKMDCGSIEKMDFKELAQVLNLTEGLPE